MIRLLAILAVLQGCAGPRIIEKTCRPAKQVPYASGQLCSCRDAKTGRFVKCPPMPPSP